MDRKGWQRGVLLLCEAVLGLVLMIPLGHYLQNRSGEAELRVYAQHALHVVETAGNETSAAVSMVLKDQAPFCSDQELAMMREFVYSASFVKDVGRTKDKSLYCTSGYGKLAHPAPEPQAQMAFKSFKGSIVEVIPRSPLLIAPQATGVILSTQGVSVVLNPNSFSTLEQHPMWITTLLYDREHKQVLPVFGRDLVLTEAEIQARKPVEHRGAVYLPVCSETFPVCVVAGEPSEAMLVHGRPILIALMALGALSGLVRATLIQFFLNPQQTMERSLRRAVRRGEIQIAYQPIVNLTTGSIVGAEALARWNNSSNEPVVPDVFILIAEQKGFIGQITQLMIAKAIYELGDLLRSPGFRVTINISASDLSDAGFFEFVDHCLDQTGIRPESLGFELTERSTAERSIAAAAIHRLRANGHPIYIDDFGTGYSSLAYLSQLEVDAIKVDKVFTRTVDTEAVTASIVPQIIDMARQLAVNLVVEGIETSGQAEFFREAGPEIMGQGWFFGRAVPAAEFKAVWQHQQGEEVLA